MSLTSELLTWVFTVSFDRVNKQSYKNDTNLDGLKIDNNKVNSYHGDQKNMLLFTQRPSFRFVPLFIANILLKSENSTKMLSDRRTDGHRQP